MAQLWLVCFLAAAAMAVSNDDILERLYAMEKLMQQDIRFLRKTVDSNSETLKDVLALLNGTTRGPSVSGTTVAGAANTPIVDQESAEKLREDIERVKRAFLEEKTHLRKYLQRDVVELHETLIEKFNTFHSDLSDYVVQYLNNITSVVKGTETNVGQFIETWDMKLNMLLSEQKNTSRAIVAAIDDNQLILHTDLSYLGKEIRADTTELIELVTDGFLYKRCSASVFEFGTTRLANLSCPNAHNGLIIQGRVEVLHDDRWGTVCDDYFNSTDATVVCRSLGYHIGIAKGGAYFGQGSGDTWLDNVQCRGTEDNIFSCPANAIGEEDCNHGEDVGVICS